MCPRVTNLEKAKKKSGVTDVMHPSEIADLLGVSTSMVWTLCKERSIPHIRIRPDKLEPGEKSTPKHQLYRFSREDVLKWYRDKLKIRAKPKQAQIPVHVLAFVTLMAEKHPQEIPTGIKRFLSAARGEIVEKSKAGPGRPRHPSNVSEGEPVEKRKRGRPRKQPAVEIPVVEVPGVEL